MKKAKIVRSLASHRLLAMLLVFAVVLMLAPAAAAEQVSASDTLIFDTAADAEKFDFYSTSAGGFAVQDGKLVPAGEAGEFKAVYKENSVAFKSVSVDILPDGGSGQINGGLYIQVSNPGNGQDAIDAIAIMIESAFSGWDDAPNRVDIALHKFNQTWAGELHRLVSETGANNALFTDGVKQPLRLTAAIDGNVITITASLVSDPSKSVTTTYTYEGEGELSLGVVGLRSQYSDASFDNFTVGYTVEAAPDGPAKTADIISVFVALMAVSAVGIAVIARKKEF